MRLMWWPLMAVGAIFALAAAGMGEPLAEAPGVMARMTLAGSKYTEVSGDPVKGLETLRERRMDRERTDRRHAGDLSRRATGDSAQAVDILSTVAAFSTAISTLGRSVTEFRASD